MATQTLKVTSAIATIGLHMLWERVSRMRPGSPPSIPPSFDAITSEWVSAALCRGIPGAAVASFQFEGQSRGSTSRTLIRLAYNEAGRRAALPELVFAKATVGFTSRMTAGMAQSSLKECNFFNSFREQLDIEAPRAFFAGYESPSQRSLLLLNAMPDCVFTNPTVYIGRAEAEDMVVVLAKLHAKFWDSALLDKASGWLPTSYDYMAMLNDFGFESRCAVGIERAASVIPPELMAQRRRIYPAAMRSLQLNGMGPQTLLHHDVHIGNWYRTPAGRMGLCDWQCLVRGGFACDLSYAISSALTVEARRAWERDLIKHYLTTLAREGVNDAPDFETAWLLYRQQFLHGFVFWGYTIGAGPLQPDMQRDDISLLNIERFSNAMIDLDTLDSV